MDVDITLIFQLGIVITVLTVVSNVLFKPLLGVLEEREAKIGGAREDVEKFNRLADDDTAAYQERMRKAAIDAQVHREKLKEEGRSKERELLSDTRASIADTINAGRTELRSAEKTARQELEGQTKELSESIVEKILGRPVGT